MKHILSLGAGVQSSTLALMAANGCVEGYPPLDGAIFADTQAEPQSVYRWLDWLEAEIARSPFPYPIYRVTAGSLQDKSLDIRVTKDGRKFSKVEIPFFVLNGDGSSGKVMFRSCTREYKVFPILKTLKNLCQIKRGQKTVGVKQWIGISLDEAHRMKPARDQWLESCWPLIDLRMKRDDCLRWMESRGYPRPPRSACVFCPFHNDHEWRRLKKEEPEAFSVAVKFEKDLQQAKARSDNLESRPFLHRSLKPLDQVDFSTAEDRGQMNFFGNECEGMCGV